MLSKKLFNGILIVIAVNFTISILLAFMKHVTSLASVQLVKMVLYNMMPMAAGCYYLYKATQHKISICRNNIILPVVVGSILLIALTIVKSSMFLPHADNNSSLFEGNIVLIIINIVTYLVAVPLLEEIYFRGYVFGLCEKNGFLISAIISSFVVVLISIIFAGPQLNKYLIVELSIVFLRSFVCCFVYSCGGIVASCSSRTVANIFNILYR